MTTTKLHPRPLPVHPLRHATETALRPPHRDPTAEQAVANLDRRKRRAAQG